MPAIHVLSPALCPPSDQPEQPVAVSDSRDDSCGADQASRLMRRLINLGLAKSHGVSHAEMHVLMVLASMFDGRGRETCTSLVTIGEMAGMNGSSVTRSLAKLEEKGVITTLRIGGGGGGRGWRNRYRFNVGAWQ